MLQPDYLLHITEGAEEIAAQLHADILKRIARRIALRMNEDYILTAIDKWQIEVLMEAGYLRDDIVKDIARATGLQRAEVRRAFRDAGVTSAGYDDRIFQAAGISTTPILQSPYFVRLMQRNYEATMGVLDNYTRTTADAAQQTFISTMDEIYNAVATGSTGYVQAFTEAIDRLGKTGVIVYYQTGHRDTIETATLRCVRTGISQASAQITDARMDEYDIDLVLVSSHMGARPDHQVWQGKIYSRSGKSRKYPDFRSSTGYGTGPGLCGWNCRHSFGPYFEGQGNPFERYNDDKNKKLYELTQQQRNMERTIRHNERRAQTLKSAMDGATSEEAKADIRIKYDRVMGRIREQKAAYNQFCADNELRPLPERLRIAQ